MPANHDLTDRETQVLRLVANGLTDKEITSIFGIARRTVSKHVSVVLLRLEARRRAEGVAIAIRRGTIELPPGA